jgi:hypothetical protein
MVQFMQEEVGVVQEVHQLEQVEPVEEVEDQVQKQ